MGLPEEQSFFPVKKRFAAINHIWEGLNMPLQNEYNKDTIKESILNKLLRYYGCTIEDATPKQVYAAVASTVRDQIMLKWRFEKEARRSERRSAITISRSSS